MSIGKLIAGVLVIRPGVYVVVNPSAMAPQVPALGGAAGFVGLSDGGNPNTTYTFTSFDLAKAVLRSGTALSYMQRMFQGSPDQGIAGAPFVRFIRANDTCAQSSLQTNGANGLIVTSRDFGAYTTSITYTLARDSSQDATLQTAGTTGTLTPYTPATATITCNADNVSTTYRVRNGLNITYSGAGATPKFWVDAVGKTANIAIGGVVVDSLPLVSTNTLQDLVNWLALHAGWSATLVGPGYIPAVALNGFSGNSTASQFGATAAFYPAEEGLLAYLLSGNDPYVTGSVAGQPVAAVTTATTALAGGAGKSSDTLSSNGLNRALTNAQTQDIQHLFVQTSSPSLQALAQQHVIAMGNLQVKRYRILYTGINFQNTSPVDGAIAGAATLQIAVDAAAAAAQALVGPVVMCFDGTTTANPVTGVQEQLGGLGLAAQICGMAAGNYDVMPLTNKAVFSTNSEFAPLTLAQENELLLAGVTYPYLDATTGNYRIRQALTTYQTDNPSIRNLQGTRVQIATQRGFDAVLSPYIGTPTDLADGEIIKSQAAKWLDSQTRSGNNPGGLFSPGFVNGAATPAWTGLQVTGSSGQGWDIQVNASPVGETDYISVRVNFVPAQISL